MNAGQGKQGYGKTVSSGASSDKEPGKTDRNAGAGRKNNSKKPNKKMKKINKLLSAAGAALGLFACIRLVTDVPAGYWYWDNPWSFIAIELSLTFIGVCLLDIFMPYWFRVNGSGRKLRTWKTVLVEWGGLFLYTFVVINGIILVTRFLTKAEVRIDSLTIADVVATLFAFAYYQQMRSTQLEEAYATQHLLLEKMKNDQLQTELKFLRAQYHPHFLFNALNTVYFQIDEKNPQPRRTLEILSDLLRYQLYGENRKVAIRQELDYLKTYVEFQKLRMSERLRLEMSVDPALQEQLVYPFLFLPLIENAFKYVGGAYRLEIRFTGGERRIGLTVFNSLPPLAERPVHRPQGIGLDNLRRRLELLYPGAYMLAVDEGDPDCYKAELTIEINDKEEINGCK